MLKLTSISRCFDGLSILQDVNIEAPQGSIFGLISPNGTSETAVFNLVTGLLTPTDGSLTFNGDSLVGKKPHQITQMGIARTFQSIRILKEMTLLENVVVGMHRHLDYGAPGLLLLLPKYRATERRVRDHALGLLPWVKLDHKAHDIADSLSYGDQRKPELTRALATESKLLLLDEPIAGMSTSEKVDLMAKVEDIKAHGYTIFMTKHDMRFVMGLCERIAVLNFGRIIAKGPLEAIRNDPQVVEAYLGRDDDDDANGGASQKETA